MDANAKKIDLFSTRVRQMILQYEELREECRSLRVKVREQEEELAQANARLQKAKGECDGLMAARMLEISDGDRESARRRLAKLIRDVDKCITLVSEQ